MDRTEFRARLATAAARNRAERDTAIAALEQAAAALACGAPIHPEGLREPVRHYMRSVVELCRGKRDLWGYSVNYALEMAAAILDLDGDLSSGSPAFLSTGHTGQRGEPNGGG